MRLPKAGKDALLGAATRNPSAVDPGEPIRTRFVIDILSGSSAGGINAVYLAKALANDQPMEELQKLWIEEGDMGVLINDKASVKGTDLDPQIPPRSLLNGRRMYWKLLDALDRMDKAPRKKGHARARNVEELDLYVTATDMAGLAVRLQLADKQVDEYRHRNVFTFRYRGDDNDFLSADNPFLAFAARCTSAHPAAFEPMRLGDVDEILEAHPSYAGDPEDFLRWDFNDGGVLDNRPFRHATDALGLHRADVPVSRKLLYLDPAPDRVRLRPGEKRPNIAENAWASLSTLPRYEPIQEDMRRALDRNRLIERVDAILRGYRARRHTCWPSSWSPCCSAAGGARESPDGVGRDREPRLRKATSYNRGHGLPAGGDDVRPDAR